MLPIQFANWILDNDYYPITTAEGKKWKHSRTGSESLTTFQLYSLYLEMNHNVKYNSQVNESVQ